MTGRFRPVSGLLVGLLLVSNVSADFDPRGRRRPGTSGPKVPKPGAATAKPKPARAQEPGARPAPVQSTPATQDEADPGDDSALIQRYKAIVINQPGAAFPLQRLAELVRKRDGNLDALLREFEQRAAASGSQQYASLVALAGLYQQAGEAESAAGAYRRALELAPEKPLALLALSNLQQKRGELAQAKELLERALPRLTDDAEREQALRTLLTLSLDLGDLPAAKRVHEQLVQRAKGSFFVQSELGQQLLARNRLAEAELEFRRVAKLARGDNRALAPALRDLAQALHRQQKTQEAIEVLEQALRATSDASGVRRELLDLMVEVYRSADRLPDVIRLLESEGTRDFARLRLLGGLYEERGQLTQALQAYQKALGMNPKDLEVRLRRVRLLELQGDLSAAIAEYRKLVVAAPHNAKFVFQLVDALLQQGQRAQAIAELRKLEGRSANDEQVQSALVDFYEKVGEKERSLQLLQNLAQSASSDPEHLVELGDRYFQAGDTEQAERIWQRLLVGAPDRAVALTKLGEVYLEHNLDDRALEVLEEAVKLAPDQLRHKRALALALERTGAAATKSNRLALYERALHIWEKLLAASKNDAHAAREARQHLVTLWGLAGTLEARLPPLERNLKADPPDLESGRLLALMYERLKQPAQAERVLSRVVTFAPGDSTSLLQLERVLVGQRKLQAALDVLKRLLQVEPSRARELYQRMANYSAELYRDDDAINYAERAVELSPDDAAGHRNLAQMYARRQQVDKAIAQYRRAISMNDRLFAAYFELAELLLARQQHAEADLLFRRVMRSANDDELIARAVRSSLQLNLSRGSVEELEKELLPLALANPDKPNYRKLLIELYSALTLPLINSLQANLPSGGAAARPLPEDEAAAARARAELARLGQRAVKPLLDALTDPQGSQQQLAIELLTRLHNEDASQALLVYAQSDAPTELRVRAMIAAGAPGHAALLPELTALLFERGQSRVDEGDPVSVAAVWCLTQLQTPRADELLAQLLNSESPSAQMLSAVALGLRGVQSSRAALSSVAKSSEHTPAARGAALFALGALGAKEAVPIAQAATTDNDERVRSLALVTLARLDPEGSRPMVAEALASGSEALRQAALGAAGLLGGGSYRPRGNPLAIPVGRVDANEILSALAASDPTPDQRAVAIVRLEAELVRAIEAAAQRSVQDVRSLSSALLAEEGRPAFAPLSTNLRAATGARKSEALASLQRITSSAATSFVRLARHPSFSVRQAALQFLAQQTTPEAQRALLEALDDAQPEVRRQVLGALAERPFPAALGAVVARLERQRDWSTRVLALETLASFPKLSSPHSGADAVALERIGSLAQHDEVAFVREAALRALLALDPVGARPVLRKRAEEDTEPRVREFAIQALGRAQSASGDSP